ncbi:amidase family protein [Mycobacterium kansasii 662]|uniref:Amidase family protein n=1 Tax=Mycobacterium kansasii 662 TaxID=1299326 RepID=X7XRH8_MYCKA|nr:amidase family protein [Mycobacterium kansasii 662]
MACASSLDQGGPCARTVLDTALLHQVIAGHDPATPPPSTPRYPTSWRRQGRRVR